MLYFFVHFDQDEMVNDVPAEDNEETSPQSAVQVIGASQGCQMRVLYKSVGISNQQYR